MATKKLVARVRPKKQPLPSQARRAGDIRKKRRPEYQSFKVHKRIKPSSIKPLPSAWRLWKMSLATLWENKKIIGLFLLIYGILYLLFVRGLSGGTGIDVSELRAAVEDEIGEAGAFLTGITLFGVFASSSNSSSGETAAFYQAILTLIGSLAFIWLLRQLSIPSKTKIRVRDAFYKGMQQLVPFVLVVLVLLLELIPLFAANIILSVVISNGLTVTALESFAAYSVCGLLALLSLYLVSGSVAALHIVTLPDSEPVQSILASHRILAYHRWSVLRKLLLLVIFVILFMALIFIPLLLVIPAGLGYIAEYVFFAGTIVVFAVVHSYLYNLYRSLL